MLEGFKDYLRHRHPDWVRIFWLLRYELQSAWIHARAGFSPRNRAAIRKFRQMRDLQLHIASGAYSIPGWINVDAAPSADLRMDLRKKLPFADSSARLIFTEHFIDHLQYPDVIGRFLRECHRVLQPGGRVRFVLHDAELLVRAYLENDERFFQTALEVRPTHVQTVNHLFRYDGFHQFIYDFRTLEKLLREVGFERVIRCDPLKSEIPDLVLDNKDPSRTVQSMYVEAIKAG